MNGNGFVDWMNDTLGAINSIIWHDFVLYAVMGVGILFTFWSGFCQYKALTHGVAVTRGKYDDKDDPGAINHFQALSAALSATVGLGNIGGVATAIALGGPGAVFWMWMIGLAGMALKTTEVGLSMMYRNTDDPDNPHGGPMFVASKGFAKMGLPGVGKIVGGIFVATLLISAITGGNMFQAWNVGEVSKHAMGLPTQLTGVILAVVVGAVIIGGIKRIGAVAGRLVPFMCAIYVLSALVVLFMNIDKIPDMFGLIFKGAFGTLESENAFMGGVAGYAFLWGMKRALFSSEAGQGSSPIAHSAAKTDEPIRESVVAGLEPFIDTIVVCTITALVILSTGAWNRGGEAFFDENNTPTFVQTLDDDGNSVWVLGTPAYRTNDDGSQTFIGGRTPLPEKTQDAMDTTGIEWSEDDAIFVMTEYGAIQDNTNDDRNKVMGAMQDDGTVVWDPVVNETAPVLVSNDIYKDYLSAALTSHAFDRAIPGFGTWMILLASWLFAISTMISWSYYGEQGVVFLFGDGAVLGYKVVYCLLIMVSTLGFIQTETELDNLTTLGTGVMLVANIPIMLIFGAQVMREFNTYFKRLKAGEFKAHDAPSITDVIEGKDVE
ncbi:MAG: alanine/glycine:cation symporter family protein [Phycisphaerales bacterium JB043]